MAPWYEVAVDLIGPWQAKTEHFEGEFFALTCIDTTTNLSELVRITTKSSDNIARKFEQTWLARYPRPMRVIHDNGGEFTGYAFSHLLRVLNIRNVSTTSKNPQSNAICERMHQTVGTILKTLLLARPPQNEQDVLNLVDDALATTMFAMRATISTVLKASPGSLAFNRDMLLNVPLVADWHTIHLHREHLVNDTLLKANAKRINYDYAIGQQVLKYDKTIKGKLNLKTSGPYEILRTHVNGTVTIQLRPDITERINIRRTLPYNQPSE